MTHQVEVSVVNVEGYRRFCERVKAEPLTDAFRAQLALSVGADLVTYARDGVLYGYNPSNHETYALGSLGRTERTEEVPSDDSQVQ